MKLQSGVPFLTILILLLCLQPAAFGKAPSARELFNKASVQYLTGDFDASLKNLQAVLKINPKDPGALELRRSILRERQELARLVNKNLAAGRELFAQGDYQRATDYFNEVIALSPDNPEASQYLEQAAIKIGKEEKSKRWYFWEAAAAASVGVFAFVLLLSTLIRVLIKKMSDMIIPAPGKINYCFNCKIKIAPNTDICPNCGAWIGTTLRTSISREQKIWYQKTGWRKNHFTLDIHPQLFTPYLNQI